MLDSKAKVDNLMNLVMQFRKVLVFINKILDLQSSRTIRKKTL